MKRTVSIRSSVLIASLVTIVLGCASYEPLVSMRGTDVAAPDKAPAPTAYVGGRPGTQQPVARTFKEQPPVIPHALDNFDEITLAENQCMDCHSREKYKEKKATKVGDSHYVAAGANAGKLSMDRYQCTNCHVPQVGAPALVENRFVGNN